MTVYPGRLFLPATLDTGVTQERTAWPSTCTVQAPHSETPQPNLVPVRPATSRKTYSSGMSSGTSKSVALPLIVKEAMAKLRCFQDHHDKPFVGAALQDQCALARTA
jgi:hypothetical protein